MFSSNIFPLMLKKEKVTSDMVRTIEKCDVKPKLVISVTGGRDLQEYNNQLMMERFRRGLIKAVETTGIYIFAVLHCIKTELTSTVGLRYKS